MTKKHEELATKIVEKMAIVEETDSGILRVSIAVIAHSKLYFNTEKKDIEMEDGSTQEHDVPAKTTKKQALELAVADIAEQLDNGDLSLSDTWAEDNL